MQIGLLVVEFYLEGCSSLKEKRSRLSGLREIIGVKRNIAVCESGYQNSHKKSEWSFVALSTEIKGLEKTFSAIEEEIDKRADALVIEIHRENI